MKKLNDSFENKWKSQFQDAEATPSTSVWDRIDANLAGSELARYKKKLFYYKITAAASIALALLFGSYSLYNIIQDSSSTQIAQDQQTEINNRNSDALITDSTDESDADKATADRAVATPDDQSQDNPGDRSGIERSRLPGNRSGERNLASQDNQSLNSQANQTKITSDQNLILATSLTSDSENLNGTSQGKVAGLGTSFNNGEIGQRNITYQPDAVFHVPYEKPGRKYYLHKKVNPYDMPYILPLEEELNQENPKSLWAGIMLSSGVFNPNISYNDYNAITADAVPPPGSVDRLNMAGADFVEQPNSIMSYKPEESSYNSEASFSYGIDFGYKFSKKFVVFSGLGYQHNYGSTTVHTYIEPTESRTKYANHAIVIERASPESGLDSYNELNSGVELNSVFEFVTIPVNVGYYLIDKRFKWIMTAGITTDVFVKNSINDSEGLFDQVQYRIGDDSPYNPIYFNGKFGTMINYTFLKNYQLSLEPSYRIGLSDLTKDNAAFSSRPSSFLISAGIAYVFR
jgi:hypothetical protein